MMTATTQLKENVSPIQVDMRTGNFSLSQGEGWVSFGKITSSMITDAVQVYGTKDHAVIVEKYQFTVHPVDEANPRRFLAGYGDGDYSRECAVFGKRLQCMNEGPLCMVHDQYGQVGV
jgi:hypothetical protein